MSKHEAGRELDALIAEKVMGLPKVECFHTDLTFLAGTLMRCNGCGEEFGQTTLAMTLAEWPFYSTDIAAAWDVVEKIDGTMTLDQDWPGRGQWRCAFNRRPRANSAHVAIADTAPLAICRAALAAVGS